MNSASRSKLTISAVTVAALGAVAVLPATGAAVSKDASAAGDGPAPVRITLKRGTGDLKTSVIGSVFSLNPNCFDHRKVTIYRKTFANKEHTSIIVRRIGYSYAERNTNKPASTRSLSFKFKLARDGTVIAKLPATDSCRAATSKNVLYHRP